MPISVSQWRGEIGTFYGCTAHAFTRYTFFCCSAIFICLLITIRFILLLMILPILFAYTFMKLYFYDLIRTKYRNLCSKMILILYLSVLYDFLTLLWYSKCLILSSGDIEMNPGPTATYCNSFSICHWNLNSISAHRFSKVSLLIAYNSIHKFDIICLSETYLDSEILSDDDKLEIPGYNLARADHPNNIKRGGVCIYESFIIKIHFR